MSMLTRTVLNNNVGTRIGTRREDGLPAQGGVSAPQVNPNAPTREAQTQGLIKSAASALDRGQKAVAGGALGSGPASATFGQRSLQGSPLGVRFFSAAPTRQPSALELAVDVSLLQRLRLVGEDCRGLAERAVEAGGPGLSEEQKANGIASELIRSRWQIVGARRDVVGGGEDLKAAFDAWAGAGRPRLTPKVLESVIDPKLNPDLASPTPCKSVWELMKVVNPLAQMGCVADGISDRINLALKEQGPNLSDQVQLNTVASEIFRSRWQLTGARHDAVGGGADLKAAFNAWVSAGRPQLTPKVLETIIDPKLNPSLAEPRQCTSVWDLMAVVNQLQGLGCVADGISDRINLALKEQGPNLSDQVQLNTVASEIIHSRWQITGARHDAVGGGADLKAAFDAWVSAGRPQLTPKVLKSVIDPQLNPNL
ncbi:MAG: hypothetical protein HY904_20740 [Deltaproteobacteria bacterium]|nr:hypothetical protein [Deltaproteobacteria bacterium]